MNPLLIGIVIAIIGAVLGIAMVVLWAIDAPSLEIEENAGEDVTKSLGGR